MTNPSIDEELQPDAVTVDVSILDIVGCVPDAELLRLQFLAEPGTIRDAICREVARRKRQRPRVFWLNTNGAALQSLPSWAVGHIFKLWDPWWRANCRSLLDWHLGATDKCRGLDRGMYATLIVFALFVRVMLHRG